jgi:uncharacterized protein (TIGR03435 family)
MTRSSLVFTTALVATTVLAQAWPSAEVPAVVKPAAATVAFASVTVQPNTSGEPAMALRLEPGGRFVVRNMSFHALVTFAYQVQSLQLVGDPDWMAVDRFDIVATLSGPPPPGTEAGSDPMMLLARALLAERFKLVAHRESRELPIFALVLAHRDGRLGPELHPATVDCRGPASSASAERARQLGLTSQAASRCGMRIGFGRIQLGGMPLSEFARAISNQLPRVVVDQTGLSGDWDVDLTFTPEVDRPSSARPIADLATSLPRALYEQLGVRLEPTQGLVDVLMIDRVERPKAD